jgi:hypothetical protein
MRGWRARSVVRGAPVGLGRFCKAISRDNKTILRTYGRFLGPVCRAFDRDRLCPTVDESRLTTEALLELDMKKRERRKGKEPEGEFLEPPLNTPSLKIL